MRTTMTRMDDDDDNDDYDYCGFDAVTKNTKQKK
jgi:hypothetical protein